MESVNCLLCNHSERRIRFRGSDRRHSLAGEFNLVECARCGFLYLSPRPDQSEIGRYYPDDYYGPFQIFAHQDVSAFVRYLTNYTIAKYCAEIHKYKSGGSLLDVGAGSGWFLAAMQHDANWTVRGLEPYGAQAAERARTDLGLTIDQCQLDEAPYTPESFDVVTLWEVLEHVPRPIDTLRRIHALLRPGGIVVLSLPNRDSWDAKIFGPYWIGLDIPRHFSVFSPKNITRALGQAGFATLRISPLRGHLGASQNGLIFSFLSFWLWLKGDTTPGPFRRLALRLLGSVSTRSYTIVLLYLLTLPYSFLARVLNRSSQMVVVARRE